MKAKIPIRHYLYCFFKGQDGFASDTHGPCEGRCGLPSDLCPGCSGKRALGQPSSEPPIQSQVLPYPRSTSAVSTPSGEPLHS